MAQDRKGMRKALGGARRKASSASPTLKARAKQVATRRTLKQTSEGNFIKAAIKKPGALRASLAVKKGKTIPAKLLNRATKAGGKLAKRANLAKTLNKLRKK